MALAPTLHDFDVALAHVDAGIERRLALKVARHPSESLERLWLRVLACCWKWEEGIAFGPGISDPEEPDLLVRGPTGEETLWIRVGRPDPVKLQREADRHPHARVAVLFESPPRMDAFVAEARERGLSRLGAVDLAAVDASLLAALAAIDERRTRLGLTIVGDHLYLERAGNHLDAPLARARVP
jgi:uncharacterized protein YaeQ